MFVIDSRDTLMFARERAVRLRADAGPDRVRRVSWKRRTLGPWLRRHGCCSHIDAAPLAHHSA
jgi:hypothetical protein